jgi:cytochrome c oxidase subunit 2
MGPLVITMVMFGWGATLYFDMSRPPDDAEEVYVVGRQWMWKVQHPGGQREINALHVPAGRPVKLILASEDVIHSFYVPDFRVKQDAVPGRYTSLWFQATQPGSTHHLFCAEYCGTEHSRMIGTVYVMEPAEYQIWQTSSSYGSLAEQGRGLFAQLQCIACHGGDPPVQAPDLAGVFRRPIPLQNGTTVIADDNYLRESILRPDAKLHAGFQPIMPPYEGRLEPEVWDGLTGERVKLTQEETLVRLLAFLKSLRPGEVIPRVEDTPPPDKAKLPPLDTRRQSR